jgi:DNA-directed RNA polymerase specialized sigma24 family protein
MGARDVLDGIAALPEEQRSVLLPPQMPGDDRGGLIEERAHPAAGPAEARHHGADRDRVAEAGVDPEAAMGARDVLDGIAALPEEQRSVLLSR